MAQQPTQVLPSNAPPLRDSLIDHASHRAVLQEQSGNRQHNYHGHAQHQPLNIYGQHKIVSSSINGNAFGENAYAYRQPSLQTSYYGQNQSYQQRPSWPRAFQDRDAEARARVNEGWQSLYNRFVNCPRYKEYRSKQHKDGKKPLEQKWPEHLEQAFFKALLYWPPMGRRKLMHKDKLRGRNELVADYIEAITLVSRNRKQVSSHIQVLKSLVDTDARIMQWLSLEDHGHDKGRSLGSYTSSYTSGRLRSTYSGAPQHMTGAARLPYASEIQQARAYLDLFQPTEFKLFVQPIQRRNAEDIEPLHIYSQSATDPHLDDWHLPDWSTFEQELPLLAKRHAQRPIDCNILLVESSLALPLGPWQDRENIEVAVILNCVGKRILTAPKVYCSNSFYKKGQPVPHLDQHGEPVSHAHQHGSGESPLTRIEATETSEAKCETSLKFGSNFWASTLNPGSTLAKSIMTSVQMGPAECARIRKSVDADVRTITAVQEISIPTYGNGLETVLLTYWTFSLSDDHIGSTTWRRLHLPPPANQAMADVKLEARPAADTPFDFNATVESTTCQQATQSLFTGPSLQSPFEYDNGSASAQSPTTWTTSISTSGSTNLTGQHSLPNSATDPISAETSFEMGQNSMLLFDTAIGVDVLDAAAFDFSISDGAAANCSFAASAAATEQVTDQQALEFATASQGWNGQGYTDSYNPSDWQDSNTAASIPGSISAYRTYANPSASAAGAGYGAMMANNPQNFANGIFGTHNMSDGRQAFPGAMQDASQPSQRDWTGFAMSRPQ